MNLKLFTGDSGCWDSLRRFTKDKINIVSFVGAFLCITPSISFGFDNFLFDTHMEHARQNEWAKRAAEDPLGRGKSRYDNPRYKECSAAHGECTYKNCGSLSGEGMNHFNTCFAACDAQMQTCLSGSPTESSSPASTGKGNTLANPIQSFAMQGDPNVQVKLGERARAMKDEAKATQWFGLAAANGHPKAQLFLGFRYLYGVGAPKNPAMADFWLRKAAAQGESVALEELMRQAYQPR